MGVVRVVVWASGLIQRELVSDSQEDPSVAEAVINTEKYTEK